MAFGETQYLLTPTIAARLYGKLVGVADFHSHFRWRGIEGFIDFSANRTLEVGAGTGVMTFEVAKRLTKDSIILASELDDSAVKTGTEIAKIGNFTNVQFIQRDLRALRLGEKFDQVLAIDVLEHIDDDLSALKEINGVLKSDGMLIISVPTPLYPKYFGREFADRIGHVRDGYFLEDITRKLDSTGFRVLKHKYYTRRWASLFCSFFYKTRIPTPKIRYIGPIIAISYFYLKLALFPFMKWLAIFLDKFSRDAPSTSLSVLSQKVRNLDDFSQ